MIQRIQSLYLLLIAVLLIAVLFIPFGFFEMPNAVYEYTAFSIQQVGASSQYALPVWILATLSICSAAIAFITIFLYKKRSLQIRFCRYNAFLMVLLVLIGVGFIFLASKGLNSKFNLNLGLALPLLTLVLNFMAISAIQKDEKLVKSWDRIR